VPWKLAVYEPHLLMPELLFFHRAPDPVQVRLTTISVIRVGGSPPPPPPYPI